MDPKKQIQKLIDDLKAKQFRDGEAKGLVQTIGDEINSQLTPAFKELASELKGDMATAFKDAVNSITVDIPEQQAPNISVNVPDVYVPEIKVPEPKVTVNVPAPVVNIPKADAPIVNFPSEMSLKKGDKPFPVMMVDQLGKPMNFPVPVGGGGRGDFYTIKDIQNSTGGSIIDSDGFLKVTGAFSVSSSNASTQAIDSSGNVYSQANPFPVTVVSGGSTTTGSAIVDSSGVQYSGSNPVPVSNIGLAVNQGDAATALRVVIAGNSDASVTATQTGTWNVKIQDLNATTFSAFTSGDYKAFPTVLLDSSGAQITSFGGGTQYAEGTSASTYTGTALIFAEASSDVAKVVSSVDPLPTTLSTALDATIDSISTYQASGAIFSVAIVSGAGNTTATNIVDSSGVAYSGSNPIPVTFSPAGSQNVNVFDGQASTVTSHQFNTDFRGLDVYVGGTFGTTVADSFNPDNRLRVDGSAVTQPVSGTVAATKSGTWAIDNPVNQGDAATALRVVVAGNSDASVSATQVGTWNIGTVTTVTTVTGVTNSIAASLVDSGGVQYSGSNPVPISDAGGSLTVDGTVTVSSVTASIASALVDSSGVAYSGSNPIPISDAAGSITVDGTVAVSGITATVSARLDTPDGLISSTNPLPITIVSGASSTMNAVYTRQANPTAVASDYVPLSADDLGRQLTRPIQVRDLIKTAYVSLTTGTETTLLAGVAGSFLDLIMLTATNNSTAATQLDIRAVTSGNIIHTMYLPATSGPIGFAPSVPWPQDATGNNWTIDMPDQTGTTVYVSALFSQEV